MSGPVAPTAPRGSVPLVVAWMTGALLSFCLSAVSVRGLSRTLGVFEFLSLRSASGIVLIGLVAACRPGGLRALALRRPALQGLRNVVHWTGQASWAWGLTVLPLATVFALEFTAPIWLSLLAVFFLGERLTLPRVGAVALGIAGILIVLRPGYLPVGLGSLAVLGAAIAFAVTAVCTKRLTRTEATLAILFWMNAIQLPLNLAGSAPDFLVRIEPGQWPAVAGLCLSGVTSHFCLTQAFRHGDATLVIPFDFLRVPLIALVGWRFYGESLDPFVFAGGATVVAGITWSLWAETRSARRPDATASRPSPG